MTCILCSWFGLRSGGVVRVWSGFFSGRRIRSGQREEKNQLFIGWRDDTAIDHQAGGFQTGHGAFEATGMRRAGVGLALMRFDVQSFGQRPVTDPRPQSDHAGAEIQVRADRQYIQTAYKVRQSPQGARFGV